MARIDERIAELTAARDNIQKQIDYLTGDGGKVTGFLKRAEAGGTLPSTVTFSDAALLIDLWEKYKATGEIPSTRSTSGEKPQGEQGEPDVRPN